MIELLLTKRINSQQGILNLEINATFLDGQCTALYGESGAGKTTLLRMIAGLTSPETGYIKTSQTTFFDSSLKINLTPQKRQVGLVFQDYALFPNMSVEQNLFFALPKGNNEEVIEELLVVNDLTHLRTRYPTQLSGGQKQRVALARALVQRPKILLMDEPLSALDKNTRHKLQDHLYHILESYHCISILVTHNQDEIKRLAKQVIVLDAGKLSSPGAPEDILK